MLVLYSSPLYKGLPDVDSSVFQVMGKGMLENKIIYKDLFDHKGPIVYIINALAFIISNKYGLFIMELIISYIGIIFVYKTAKIILSKRISLFASFLYILISFKYFYGGNFTEEYAITFMSIAMYFIIKILYKGESNKKIYWIIIGTTFTINLLIKPTYISIWVAFGIVQLISSIKDRKIKELIKNIGYIIIGVLIILIPIILYIIINNDINDFIEAYIGMNMRYSESTMLEKITSFESLVKKYSYNIYFIIMLISNIVILFSKYLNKRTKSFVTLFSIGSLLLTAWKANGYNHYLIQLAPCVTLESIFFIYKIEKIIEEKQIVKYKIIKELPINFIYICIILFVIINITQTITKSEGIFSQKMKNDEIVINKVVEVNNYLDKEDEILVLGNNSYYYLLFNKQPEFKYFFQYPIIKYDEKIKDEIEKYIIEKKPKIIIKEIYKELVITESKLFEQIYGERVVEEVEKNYEEHDIGVIKYYVLREE